MFEPQISHGGSWHGGRKELSSDLRTCTMASVQEYAEENTKAKCGVDNEGKATQRLPQTEIHPTYNHQTQTILWMQTSECSQETDIAVC